MTSASIHTSKDHLLVLPTVKGAPKEVNALPLIGLFLKAIYPVMDEQSTKGRHGTLGIFSKRGAGSCRCPLEQFCPFPAQLSSG